MDGRSESELKLVAGGVYKLLPRYMEYNVKKMLDTFSTFDRNNGCYFPACDSYDSNGINIVKLLDSPRSPRSRAVAMQGRAQ